MDFDAVTPLFVCSGNYIFIVHYHLTLTCSIFCLSEKDVDLAHIVYDYRHAKPFPIVEHLVQQRSLPRAEETAEYLDRQAGLIRG